MKTLAVANNKRPSPKATPNTGSRQSTTKKGRLLERRDYGSQQRANNFQRALKSEGMATSGDVLDTELENVSPT
jgi:hypothetical protein